MNDTTYDTIMDCRTPFKANKNYEISKYNEEVAMEGFRLVVKYGVGIVNVTSEKIDSNESWVDGKLHICPDFFLHTVDKDGVERVWTIEVKTTCYDSFLNDEIIIKAPQVWSCKNDSVNFPRPYILACTDREFALIPMGSFWNSPPQDIKFGETTKKGYILRCSDYKWQPFVSPLKFKKYGNNNYKKF